MEADAEFKFKEAFLDVDRVRTHVIQYGLSDVLTKLSDSSIPIKSPLSDHKYAIVLIPGNPGAIQFYKHFLESIYKQLKIPVIGVSHAGHVKLESNQMPSSPPQDDYYSVNGQILHKLLVIENYFPKHVNLILIGHSLGAYIILEMLKTLGEERKVARNILVFPVIERMYELWRAKIFTVLFTILFFPILVLVFFLNLFSEKWKLRIVRFVIENVYNCRNYPECIINGGSNFFNTTVVRNIIGLLRSEVQQIRELQVSVIENRIKTLSLMYGDVDSWCPLRYYEEISQRFPGEDITLPFKQIPHAFVVDNQSSDFVVKTVCENIRSKVLNSRS